MLDRKKNAVYQLVYFKCRSEKKDEELLHYANWYEHLSCVVSFYNATTSLPYYVCVVCCATAMAVLVLFVKLRLTKGDI